MPQTDEFDAIVIGAGEAGALLASHAVAAGRRVAMIYQPPYGSTCVNVGCVPSKFLIARARIAHVMRSAGRFGIGGVEPAIDLPRIVAEKEAMVAEHRAEGLANARRAERLTLVEGTARFVSPTSVDVEGRRLAAPKVFIATGMRPAIPRIEGLDEVPYHTNETIMDLPSPPRHLVVIGGGYVGAELAQAYRRFGSEVTLVGRNERLVPGEEPEASALLAEAFAEEGIHLLLGQAVERVEQAGDGIVVHAAGERLEASHLLVAAGRQPNSDRLNLGAAGVAVRNNGAIVVDGRMRTNADGIWAIGDVNGEQPFTRVCQEEAKVCFADAFGDGHPGLDRLPLGHAVFTDPEIGSVGLTEAQARQRGVDVVAGSVELGQVEKAELLGETRGVIKLVAERSTRRMLGLHVVGPSAADLVYDAALVIRRHGSVDDIAATVGIFPTLQEGVEGTARAFVRALTGGRHQPAPAYHHAPANIACSSCAAVYELRPRGQAGTQAAGSFACPSCAADYDLVRSAPGQITYLDSPANSFACPSCAGELEARVSRRWRT